mmetsp:Transcript_40667/g.105132  ORF Transcript_40667/g.105132 Transcript_40667/m.105132 type:complete len:208 (-) Transcript_40667:107-730(-)
MPSVAVVLGCDPSPQSSATTCAMGRSPWVVPSSSMHRIWRVRACSTSASARFPVTSAAQCPSLSSSSATLMLTSAYFASAASASSSEAVVPTRRCSTPLRRAAFSAASAADRTSPQATASASATVSLPPSMGAAARARSAYSASRWSTSHAVAPTSWKSLASFRLRTCRRTNSRGSCSTASACRYDCSAPGVLSGSMLVKPRLSRRA